jgi:hypothetical protein
MRQGDVIYTNSVECRNRPGPKPELRMTFKAPAPKSFVMLVLGATDKPLESEDLETIMASFGWVRKT